MDTKQRVSTQDERIKAIQTLQKMMRAFSLVEEGSPKEDAQIAVLDDIVAQAIREDILPLVAFMAADRAFHYLRELCTITGEDVQARLAQLRLLS